MRAEELWKAYCEKENIDIDTPYSAWGFGDAPDQLADLVLKGIKTATASAYDLYFMEGEEEPLPQLGDYSVILDSKDEAICIIQTTKTTVVPFNEVSEEHAYKEGEGDRSLAYWRAVHEENSIIHSSSAGSIRRFDVAETYGCTRRARGHPGSSGFMYCF